LFTWANCSTKMNGEIMTKNQKIAISLAIASGVLLASSPAMAEGTWSSYLSSVGTGFSSRTWSDNALDQVATTVKLSGCSMNTGGTFSSATLNLYREYGILPDISMGSISNACNTSNWGQALGADTYHFTIDKINGSTSSTPRFSATSVVTNY
jgi:hypothetical protein